MMVLLHHLGIFLALVFGDLIKTLYEFVEKNGTVLPSRLSSTCYRLAKSMRLIKVDEYP